MPTRKNKETTSDTDSPNHDNNQANRRQPKTKHNEGARGPAIKRADPVMQSKLEHASEPTPEEVLGGYSTSFDLLKWADTKKRLSVKNSTGNQPVLSLS
jgi:hypothetical protein